MEKKKDFQCKACGADFETREQLEQHNRKEHPEMMQGSQQQQQQGTRQDTER